MTVLFDIVAASKRFFRRGNGKKEKATLVVVTHLALINGKRLTISPP
jgi:hypothetical protein